MPQVSLPSIAASHWLCAHRVGLFRPQVSVQVDPFAQAVATQQAGFEDALPQVSLPSFAASHVPAQSVALVSPQLS